MGKRVVWIDGKSVALDEARVSVFDRGFLYGDSVFETLRTYGGAVFALHLHLERLARSAEKVSIVLPVSLEILEREVRSAVQEAGFDEAYVRLVISRGVGELGLDPSLALHPTRVLLVESLKVPSSDSYSRGIAAISFRAGRPQDGTQAEGAKLGNYLTAVLATQAMKAAGAQEALLVDGQGRALEGATSNFFFVKNGELRTPPLEVGILDGITRRFVLEVAESIGLSLSWTTPDLTDLYDAEEIFVCSSIRELLAVIELDGRRIGAGKPGPVFLRLFDEFRRRTRGITGG